MPLTDKGKKILNSMEQTYGSPEKAKQVLYASANKGTISGVHDSWSNKHGAWARDVAVPPLTTAANAGVPQASRHARTGYDRSSMGSVSMNGSWRGRSA